MGQTAVTAAQLIVNLLVIGGKVISIGGSLSIKGAMMVVRMRNAVYYGKWRGRAGYRRLRRIKGDNLAYFEVGTQDKKALKRIGSLMKKKGLLYSRLPDLDLGDGKTQFCFSMNELPVFNLFLRAYNEGVKKGVFSSPVTVIGEEDYARTGFDDGGRPTKEMEEIEKGVKEEHEREKKQKNREARKDRKSPSFREETPEGRMEISVNKVLYRKSPEGDSYTIRVPGSGGMGFAVTKEEARQVDERNLAVSIDPEKMYPCLKKDGAPAERPEISGKEILGHFHLEKRREFFQSVENRHEAVRKGIPTVTIAPGNVIRQMEEGYLLSVPGSNGLGVFVPISARIGETKAGSPILSGDSEAFAFRMDDLNVQEKVKVSSLSSALASSREKNLKALRNLEKSMAERGRKYEQMLMDSGEGLTDFLKRALTR